MSTTEVRDVPSQEQLQADADSKSRRGFVGSQVFPITGATATEVNTTSGASSNGGLTVGGIGISVKPVDRRTIEGSTPGDFRSSVSGSADAAMHTIANPPGPRDPVGQFPLSGKTPAAPQPASFVGNLADSDAGN